MAVSIVRKDSTERASTWEFIGESTDSKPTLEEFPELPNGSDFLEMDTGEVFFWSSSQRMWVAPSSS